MSGAHAIDPALDDALDLITRRLRAPQGGQTDQQLVAARTGSLPQIARTLYRERRMRAKSLEGIADFGEPAWDILLDLYVAGAEGRKVGVSSACIASCVPATTGLRWLLSLEASGAIERETDPTDGRRSYVRLTVKGEQAMTAYLHAIGGDRP